jgi:hypothetical protein
MCIWAYIYSVFHCARVGVLYICLYICAYASMAYKYVIVFTLALYRRALALLAMLLYHIAH